MEGPWADEIPFDSRDVWQFTLVLDDHKQNMWVVKKNSFCNIGPSCHACCWPWSSDTEIPYKHKGTDSTDIHENYPLTMCIGPFGCSGDHAHDFAGAA